MFVFSISVVHMNVLLLCTILLEDRMIRIGVYVVDILVFDSEPECFLLADTDSLSHEQVDIFVDALISLLNNTVRVIFDSCEHHACISHLFTHIQCKLMRICAR